MSGVTLAQAQTGLANALSALERAEHAISYSTGDLSVERARIKELRLQVKYWESRVAELSAVSEGTQSPLFISAKFR